MRRSQPNSQRFPATRKRPCSPRRAFWKDFGPQLGRPHVDTLKGSKHANMKELRFDAADGVWRAAFAFDALRQAVVLVAGDKSGESQARFYRTLIATADKRFDAHLAQQKKGE